MALTVKILITVTLLYYLSRATWRAVALSAGIAAVSLTGKKLTKDVQDKLDHATGKAVIGAAGGLGFHATLITLIWIWL